MMFLILSLAAVCSERSSTDDYTVLLLIVALTAYNSTTVPSRRKVTIEH